MGLEPTFAQLVELDELRAVMTVCRRVVAAQAEDGSLWNPVGVAEAYVVQELRALHRAVEGDLAARAAVEDM